MPYLTLERLIDDDGELDPIVYQSMVRRRALNEHGALSPSALRKAASHYDGIIPFLIRNRREAMQGQPQ